MDKSLDILNLMDKLSKEAGGPGITGKTCPLCSLPVEKMEFKDELSKREFDISGTCQKCQDNVF